MAKTPQRRIVKLRKNAVDWLLPLAPKHPALVPTALQRHFGGPDGGKDGDRKKLRP